MLILCCLNKWNNNFKVLYRYCNLGNSELKSFKISFHVNLISNKYSKINIQKYYNSHWYNHLK